MQAAPMNADLGWPLARAARLRGEATAVVDGERRVTYAELGHRVRALGTALDHLGIAAGGRVGVLACNSLAHLEWFLGVPAFGRVLTDLNFRLSEDELAFMVDDAAVAALLVDDDQLEVARALRSRCESLRVLVHDGLGACPADCVAHERLVELPPAERIDVDEQAPAVISYTGGTTGTPKGVVLSHRNLIANAVHNLIVTGHRPEDRFLHVCPMFHVAGTANVVAATWVGCTQVVLPRFDAAAVLRAVAAEQITLTTLVPTMIAMLLDELERAPADLTTLRELSYAASPIAPDLQRRALEALPCDLAQLYGMTEAAPTVTRCSPEDHRRGLAGEEPYRTRMASVGVPVPGVEAEVRGPDGARLPAGEVGEVWVRGPNVMLGYWRRPEATEAALVDGWYRSGDAAYADEDGYLYLVDRLKDMIITGGENVYSIEVEAVLASHPHVVEAAVFGIPDARWGEAVHAVVTIDGEVGADELVAHCRTRIAGFKVPRSIELTRDPLPRTGAGKIRKNALREPHWAAVARRVN